MGGRGLPRTGSFHATQKHHPEDDAPRQPIAPKPNGSRSKALIEPARTSDGWSAISKTHLPPGAGAGDMLLAITLLIFPGTDRQDGVLATKENSH
jgi:hypothetical protein